MARYQEIQKVDKWKIISIVGGILIGLLFLLFAFSTKAYFVSLLPVVIIAGVVILILSFNNPFFGLMVTVSYSFLMGIFDREIGGLSYGMGVEAFLIVTWLSVWYNAKKFDFKSLNNDLVKLTFIWFIISVLELFNLSGASPRGWLQEVRSTALYPLLIAPLGVLLINTKERLNIFITIVFVLSFLATLNGLKQEFFGLSKGEQYFLDTDGALTHVLFGHIRYFSFYSDASQFGPSQAHISLIALIFAISLKTSWPKRILLLILSALSFYGMLISGTRGALFVIAFGVVMAIALSKHTKALIWGTGISLICFSLLKFTYIGNDNYQINRLRSAINPEDASFNVRIINQAKLSTYLANKPFGEGLGVIGHWGREFNSDKYLSTIAPDSYWVKVWAMYGVVGLTFFFCMWMYWMGKSAGMLWNMQDKPLRVKLIALLAGVFGIFICSYGNEVMNTMPSTMFIQLSLGAIYIMCANYKKTLN